jgi:hypothetical protein
MFSIESKGSFDNTESFLRRASSGSIFATLERFGQMGVDALRAATPADSGETANGWYYEVVKDSKSWSIIWGNNNVVDGRPIAVLLQYGHGTRNGGFVQGRDYINPALQPIFDQITAEAWKAVTA